MWMVLNHGKGVACKVFISPNDLYLKSKAVFYGRCPKGALCLLWQVWLGTVKLGIFMLDKLVSIGR